MEPSVQFEVDGHVATVTINRPGKLNAIDGEVFADLVRAFQTVEADPDIFVAVLAAAGDKSFSVGADLEEYIPRLTCEGLDVLVDEPSKRFLSEVTKPVIAAVRGFCLAGGTELMLGTDIRIVGSDATFGLPEVRWGLVPASGAHVRLLRQIPWAIGMQLLLTGKPVDAARAYEIGLVNEVVAPDGVLGRAQELATQIAENGPIAIRTAKATAVRTFDLERKFEIEYDGSRPIYETSDSREGPRAFVERRKPEFQGR